MGCGCGSEDSSSHEASGAKDKMEGMHHEMEMPTHKGMKMSNKKPWWKFW